MSKIKIIGVEQKQTVGILNFYDIKYLTKSGELRVWNMFSRKNEETFKKNLITKRNRKADGVVVASIHRETGKFVVIEEYRVAINSKIITLPGGLVDEGETYEETAIREMKEETGLDLIYVDKDRGMKPRYSAMGVTDETVAIVYGECTGIPKDMQGDNEQGKVRLLSRKDIKEILNSDKYEVAGRTELILELYLLKADKMSNITYVNKEIAFNSGKRIRPKGANIDFLTSLEMDKYLNWLNPIIAERYINSEWEVECL